MDIYEQHKAAFLRVSAAAIVSKETGKHVGNVSFKYPQDGAARLWCYVHFFGQPMVRAYAGGYGYDKRTAAFVSAMQKVNAAEVAYDITPCLSDDGTSWGDKLIKCGLVPYNVL